jgi:hypothetical protein
MDRKTFSIGILSITAVVLLIAQFIPVRPAAASGVAVNDRDYKVATCRVTTGGDGLYLVNRRGQMAFFMWDTGSRTLRLRASRPVTDAFAQ